MALQPLKLMFIYALIVFFTVQHLRCTHSLLLNGRGEDTQGVWTWVGGSDRRNQNNVVDGTQKCPGSRRGASSWVDSNGTVWIYGGTRTGMKPLHELWSLDVKRQQWHFHQFNKSISSEQKPPPCFGCALCSYENRVMVFSSLGAFIFYVDENRWSTHDNQTDFPVPRSHAASWCDTNKGIMWMFGGYTASEQKLGDFWKFSLGDMQWTKIEVKNNTSLPSNRSKASAWIHPSGHLYMFGGATNNGLTSEFWKFSTEASDWMKVSRTFGRECTGNYGEQGTPSNNNHPGCREGAATWLHADNLWMFGGSGFDNFSRGVYGESGLLSDLWVYSISRSQWVWIGGLSRGEGIPVFGKKRKQDVHNIPGPRVDAVSFSIGETLWLFGGEGHDVKQFDGILNDLWKFEQVRLTIPTTATHVPGDTIHITFGFRVLIAIFILTMGLVGTICACYSKECQILRLKGGLRPVVKYKPVEVEMIQVPQPELHAPLEEPYRPLNRDL